jgi:hypothetical protein
MRSIVRRIVSVAAVLLFVLAGVADGASSGLYAGRTDQRAHGANLAFSLTVTGQGAQEVYGIEYDADYTGNSRLCSRRFDGSLTSIAPALIIKHGAFGATKVKNGSRLDLVTGLHGQFHGNTVSGSFTETFTATRPHRRPIRCTTGKVTFTAGW